MTDVLAEARPITPSPPQQQQQHQQQQQQQQPVQPKPVLVPGSFKAAHVAPDTFSPVDQNGSFCFDRVLKRGKVQRRIKHKGVWKHSWRSAYLVLRPNLLSIYKNEDETNLRASIALSDITAVARVKKGHAEHVFAVFSPAKNHYFQAASERDAADWVHHVRLEARPDHLDSLEPPNPAFGQPSGPHHQQHHARQSSQQQAAFFDTTDVSADESPEVPGSPVAPAWPVKGRTSSSNRKSSLNTNASISIKPPAVVTPGSPLQDYATNGHYTTSVSDLDFSDFHAGSLPKAGGGGAAGTAGTAGTSGGTSGSFMPPLTPIASEQHLQRAGQQQPQPQQRNPSQLSVLDQERIIRQGWLQVMRSKTGGIKAWKSLWVVLRPRNVCFYKNEQEYSAVRVLSMSAIIDAAEIDALSRHKQFCFQIIADDRTYRLCAPSEEALAKWLGSLKSVLSKRLLDLHGLDPPPPPPENHPATGKQKNTDKEVPDSTTIVEATRDLSLRA